MILNPLNDLDLVDLKIVEVVPNAEHTFIVIDCENKKYYLKMPLQDLSYIMFYLYDLYTYSECPNLHDVFMSMLKLQGVRATNVCIVGNDIDIHYANLCCENLSNGNNFFIKLKLSDGIILALKEKVPLKISKAVLNDLDDVNWSSRQEILTFKSV